MAIAFTASSSRSSIRFNIGSPYSIQPPTAIRRAGPGTRLFIVSSEKRTTVDDERSDDALDRPSSSALRASWRWCEVRGAVGVVEEMTDRAVSSEETMGSSDGGEEEAEKGREDGRSGRELERSDMLGSGAGGDNEKGYDNCRGGENERIVGDSEGCGCSAAVCEEDMVSWLSERSEVREGRGYV